MSKLTITTADLREFFAYCESLAPGTIVDPSREVIDFAAARPWVDRYIDLYGDTTRTYEVDGYTLGYNPWLLSSIEAFDADPRLLVIGINPAGSHDYPEHRGMFRYESENAYYTSGTPEWVPMQRQVQAAMRELQRRIGDTSDEAAFACKRIVTGNFIPFRSPGEKALPTKAFTFGRNLWRTVFSYWQPQYVLTYGDTARDEISALLGRWTGEKTFDCGWKGKQLTLREFDRGVRLLALPHLSRFRIFGRSESEAGIAAAFDALVAQ